jgi:hypothetical protein
LILAVCLVFISSGNPCLYFSHYKVFTKIL